MVEAMAIVRILLLEEQETWVLSSPWLSDRNRIQATCVV